MERINASHLSSMWRKGAGESIRIPLLSFFSTIIAAWLKLTAQVRARDVLVAVGAILLYQMVLWLRESTTALWMWLVQWWQEWEEENRLFGITKRQVIFHYDLLEELPGYVRERSLRRELTLREWQPRDIVSTPFGFGVVLQMRRGQEGGRVVDVSLDFGVAHLQPDQLTSVPADAPFHASETRSGSNGRDMGLMSHAIPACRGKRYFIETPIGTSEVLVEDDGPSQVKLSFFSTQTPIGISEVRFEDDAPGVLNCTFHRSLFAAAETGDAAAIAIILRRQPRIDLNETNKSRQTPLMIAAYRGHAAVVRELLTSNRIDPDKAEIDRNSRIREGETALILAAQNGHALVVTLLLADERVDPNITVYDIYMESNGTALMHAAKHGHTSVVTLLLADERVDPSTALAWAAKKNHTRIVRLLLADDRVDPNAAAPCRPEGVSSRFFVKTWTALMHAADEGHTSVVALLLADERVDPNSMSPLNEGTTPEFTALKCAADKGHTSVVKLLLADERVDPNLAGRYSTTDPSGGSHARGFTAFAIAAMCGHTSVVKLLLADERVDPDADVWSPTCAWSTALMFAVMNGHASVLAVLLANNRVDPNKSSCGFNHLTCLAAAKEDTSALALLLADGRIPRHRPVQCMPSKNESPFFMNVLIETYKSETARYDNELFKLKRVRRARFRGLVRAVVAFRRMRRRTRKALKRRLEDERRDRMCSVCLEREKTVLLLPCRHLCLCSGCSAELEASPEHGNCPMCRKYIEKHVEIYV